MADELAEFFGSVGTSAAKRPRGNSRVASSHGYESNPGRVVSADAAVGESRWSEADGLFWRAQKTHSIIPSGLYNCTMVDGIGPALRKQELKTDDLLVLPEPNSAHIIKEFEHFWTLEERFKQFGFLYKRGFLLWGPPGSGKTSLINLMMKTIIKAYGGIIVVVEDPDWASACLSMIRKNEPTRPLITILEDLDALVERWGEAGYLNLLDGSEQINNVIHIGTTNYPEKLDRRFVDRPSRFDTVVKIGFPGADARREYFRTKMEGKNVEWWTAEEHDRWTRMSEGFSVAHMREMIIAVCGLGQDLEEVVRRLSQMHKRQPSSTRDPDGPPVGFAVSKTYD